MIKNTGAGMNFSVELPKINLKNKPLIKEDIPNEEEIKESLDSSAKISYEKPQDNEKQNYDMETDTAIQLQIQQNIHSMNLSIPIVYLTKDTTTTSSTNQNDTKPETIAPESNQKEIKDILNDNVQKNSPAFNDNTQIKEPTIQKPETTFNPEYKVQELTATTKTETVETQTTDTTNNEIQNDKEFQAKNTVVSSLESEVSGTYQLLFNEDLSLSGLSNDEIKENLTEKFSESSLAKLAYAKQEQSELFISANDGKLTNQDYYNSAVDTLMTLFPDSDTMSESLKSNYKNKINTLSLDEINEFQNKALELPTSNSANYQTAVNDFKSEFLNKTNGKSQYVVSNPNETVSFNQVFEQTYGVEYDEEKINNLNVAQTTYAVVQQTEIGRKSIHTNLDNTKTNSQIEEGVLANISMYSPSTTDEDMTATLQKLTNMTNVSVVDGKVQGDLGEIKTNMLETVDMRALELYNSVNGKTTNSQIPTVKTGMTTVDRSSMLRSSSATGSTEVSSRSVGSAPATSTSSEADKAFSEITSNLESSYKDAYGEKSTEQLTKVAEEDMNWVDYTRMGIEGLGVAVSVASAFVPGVGLAGMALGGAITSFAGVGFEIATEVVNGLINGNVDTDRIKDLYSEMGTNGLLFGAGMAIGGAASSLGNIAKSATSSVLGKYVSSISSSVSNAISNAASFLVDKGSDFLMSIMGNSVITGDMNVTGELIAQVAGTVIPGIKNSDLGQSTLAKLGLSAGDFSGAIKNAGRDVIFSKPENNVLNKTFAKDGITDEVKDALVDISERMMQGELPDKNMYDKVIEKFMDETGFDEKVATSKLNKALESIGWTALKGSLNDTNSAKSKSAAKKAIDNISKNIEKNTQTATPKTETPVEKQPDTTPETKPEVDTTPSTKDDTVVLTQKDGETTVQNKSEVDDNAKTETENKTSDSETNGITRGEKYDYYLQKYPELENLRGYDTDDIIKAGDLLENYQRPYSTDADYANFDSSEIWQAIRAKHLPDLSSTNDLFKMIKEKYYPEVVEWENYAKAMKDKYNLSQDKLKDAEALNQQIKDMIKNNPNKFYNFYRGNIDSVVDDLITDSKFRNLANWDSQKVSQYIKDDPDIQNLLNKQTQSNQNVGLKDNGLNPDQVQDVTNILRNPVNKNYLNGLNNNLNPADNTGLNNAGFNNDPFGLNNNDYSNNNYNNYNNPNNDSKNESPIPNTSNIPTPELNSPDMGGYDWSNFGQNNKPEVKGIETTTDSYEFSGNINDSFGNDAQIPENKDSLDNKTSEEKFNDVVKDAENKAFDNAREKYGWDSEITTDTKTTIDENGNFQVKIDVTVKGVGVNSTPDTNGNSAGNNNQTGNGANTTNGSGTGSGTGTGTGTGIGTGSGIGNGSDKLSDKTSLGKTASESTPNTLPTNDGTWNGSFGQSIIYNYGNSDGTINTDALINDWSSAGGDVYSYTGSAAQNAFSALQNGTWDAGTNYGSTNTGYTEDWSWTGFDVFSPGGGWDDPWGTMSFYGGGAGSGDRSEESYARPLDTRKLRLEQNSMR